MNPQKFVSEDIYLFFVVAFGAAPGTTYLSQLQQAADVNFTTLDFIRTFVGKKEFTDRFPTNDTNEIFAEKFVRSVIRDSASEQAIQTAKAQTLEALAAGFDKGLVILNVINNLATRNSDAASPFFKTAQLFKNQVAAAKAFSEPASNNGLGLGGLALPPLQEALAKISADSDVSTPEKAKALVTPSATGFAPRFSNTAQGQQDSAPLKVSDLNDPLFASQWYLNNTGQRGQNQPNLDINIADAWARGYVGKGIIVGVSDDGIDLSHEDLAPNMLVDLTYNGVDGRTGATAFVSPNPSQPYIEAKDDPNGHGTVVASIVAMSAKNGTGMVGIANGSKVVGALAVANNAKLNNIFDYLTNTAKVDVSVNSFGNDPAFSENYYIAPGTSQAQLTEKQIEGLAIENAAKNGRNGLGMIIEVSAGNERKNNADAGLTSFTSSKYIIASGAMNEKGEKASYTTGGASVLLSSFGGENPNGLDQNANSGFGLASADVSGSSLGYNKTADFGGNYNFQNTGTSYSGPMIGATAALMLQANPGLGFRDVQNILAYTARGVAAEANQYTTNGATDWNLGGMHFSRDVGFGLLDVSAAVRLAESWFLPAGTVANWQTASGTSAAPQAVIPDGNAAGLSVSANINAALKIERMEFEIDLGAALPSQLRAEITSPSGTTIVLFNNPLTRQLDNDKNPTGEEAAWPGVFSIMSPAFMGENAAGNWTLKLVDTVAGTEATYKSFTVKAWGTMPTQDSQFIFTNEFSGAKTLTDTAGVDTIQASALAGNATISLVEGATSTIGGGQLTIAASSVIENVISGAGNDILTGNATNNIIRGNGGADRMTGGGGADTFVFGHVLDSTAAARDVITDFVVGLDKIDLRFIDASLAMAGDQEFNFLGGGVLAANGLNVATSGSSTIVRADNSGDGVADFELELLGLLALSANDFLGLQA